MGLRDTGLLSEKNGYESAEGQPCMPQFKRGGDHVTWNVRDTENDAPFSRIEVRSSRRLRLRRALDVKVADQAVVPLEHEMALDRYDVPEYDPTITAVMVAYQSFAVSGWRDASIFMMK